MKKLFASLAVGVALVGGTVVVAHAASGDLEYVEQTYGSPAWGTMNYFVTCPSGHDAVAGHGFVLRSNGDIIEANSQFASGGTWYASLSVPYGGGPYTATVAAICRD